MKSDNERVLRDNICQMTITVYKSLKIVCEKRMIKMSPGRATSDEQTCYRRNEYSTKRLTNKYKKNVEKLQRKKKHEPTAKRGIK